LNGALNEMARYLAGRLLLTLPTLLLATALIFFMVRLVPGDPAEVLLGDIENPAALAQIRASLGLDQPIWIQYGRWLGRVFQGDLGMSIVQQRPVAAMLLSAFGVTASLVVPAVLFAVMLAIPAGSIAAWQHNKPADTGVMAVATLFLSIPSFWLGLLFLLVFGVKLDLFPVVGYVSPLENVREGLRYLVLPVLALALIETGVLVRMVRSSTLDVLSLEYVTHARAKGLSEWTVMRRHVLRNAMAPTWTLIGLTLGTLLGGAVVTETVFTLPGIGRLMVEAIFARDYPVVQGCMLLITITYVAVNLLIELSYPLFDPGVRLEQ
jgi:peptide/nickel transport system permease protein